MDRIGKVLTLAACLGVSSFVVGALPLSFAFSSKRKRQLSTLGNGLLLGAALGVIIPEGIEAVSSESNSVPVSTIALCLLVGFVGMLVVEQYLDAPHTPAIISPNSRGTNQPSPLRESVSEFPMDPIGEGEVLHRVNRTLESMKKAGSSHITAHPLTLGLFIHSLADGLALGASVVGENRPDSNVSLVVFFALMVHKSPAALALTSSLLSTSLTRSEIRKHLAFFSLGTPIGALLSFILLSFVKIGTGNWTGMALLISGGTFLYVATIIQHSNAHSYDYADPTEDMGFILNMRHSAIHGYSSDDSSAANQSYDEYDE